MRRAGCPGCRSTTSIYPLVTDLADLTYLVNLNSLEVHVPQWTVGDDGERRNPDRLVIDLDPGKPAGLHECAQVALLVRERLAALGLEMYPVTSGSKGMQLYAALGGDLTSDQVRDLAMQLAQEMTKKHPDLVLWKMTKSLRPGKIFLDWSQNVAAKTTISPYSLRGRELPCVAAPRTWDEVERGAAEPDSSRSCSTRCSSATRRRPAGRPALRSPGCPVGRGAGTGAGAAELAEHAREHSQPRDSPRTQPARRSLPWPPPPGP